MSLTFYRYTLLIVIFIMCKAITVSASQFSDQEDGATYGATTKKIAARCSVPVIEGLDEAFNELISMSAQEGYSLEKLCGKDAFNLQSTLTGFASTLKTFKKKFRIQGAPQFLIDRHSHLIEKIYEERRAALQAMLAARNAPQSPHLTPTEPKAQASLISVSRKSSSDSSSSIDSDEQPGLEDHIEGVSKSTLIRRKPIQNGSAASTDSDGSDGDGPSALSAFRK